MNLETMLLAVDIGNSSIKFGVFNDEKLTERFSVPTSREHTPSELHKLIGDRLVQEINAAIVCSVVDEVNAALAAYVAHFVKVEPRFIESTEDLGLKFTFSTASTGCDRLVNSFAAAEKFGVPVIVISMGTATTIDIVDADLRYLGGLIAPGIATVAKALSLATARLPEVEIRKPQHIIAETTDGAIRSGIVYGHVAMVEGLLKRIKAELAFAKEPMVVATGGFADIVAPETEQIDLTDAILTLDGLRMLHQRGKTRRA